MDPLSIAAAATGLTTICIKISERLYTWVDEARNLNNNVTGFCEEILSLGRVLAAVSKSIKENPILSGAGFLTETAICGIISRSAWTTARER